MTLDNCISSLRQVSFVLGVILAAYVGINVVYVFNDLVIFYAVFVAGIIIISALEAIIASLEKIADKSSGFNIAKLAINIAVFIITVLVSLYIACNAERLQIEQPFISDFDVLVGWFFVGVIIFLVTVHWGYVLGGAILLSVVYLLWGHHIKVELLAHPYYDTKFSISYLGMNATEGFFRFVGLITEQIYFLVLFATVLLGVGLLKLFMELGKAVGKHVTGGAAFPAIFGSTAVGSVMGQAVSNIALTGQLTIPMMKKYGFRSSTAGAIEVIASTSGQLVPPILGLAAFIIAAVLNVPYIEIAMNAVYPALLYVITTTVLIWLNAGSDSIPHLREDIDWHAIRRLLPTFLIPFGLVLTLLIYYYSPSIAGLVGIPLIIILAYFQGKKYRPSARNIIGSIREGLKLLTLISLLGIGIGSFAQVIGITGVASNLGAYFSIVLPDNMILLLIITMCICIIAGMGLPTPVAYLLVALTVGPFLQKLGVPALSAHFFVFYFAIFSALSPPVALGCLTAAKISGGSFIRTCVEALKLAGPTFLTPFIFIYNPCILEFPEVTTHGVYMLIISFLVQIALGVGLVGFLRRKLNLLERLLFIATALCGLAYLFGHNIVLLIVFWALYLAAVFWVAVLGAGKRAGAPPVEGS